MYRRSFPLAALFAAADPAAEDVRRTIQRRLDAFGAALVKGDAAAAAEVFAPDALYLPAGAANLIGRPAIERHYAARFEAVEIIEARLVSDEVVVAGEWAFERGTNEVVSRKRSAAPAPRQRSRGKYLTLWRRTGAGEWQILWDMPGPGQHPPETLPPA
jgi:uncharacterized protein (TIGR02246 family)